MNDKKAIINSSPGILYPIISRSNPFGLKRSGTSPAINSTINMVIYIVAPIGAEIKRPVKKYLLIKLKNLFCFFSEAII